MYSLDINFLKDRGGYDSQAVRTKSKPMPAGSMTPLFVGLAVGLIPLGLVGGLLLFTQHQTAQKQEELAALNGQLDKLKIGQKRLDDINAQTAKIQEETNALITVFDQIKPWSAILQDIRDRTPPGLQITGIQQTMVASTASSGSASSAVSKAAKSRSAPRTSSTPIASASPAASPQAKAGATPAASTPPPQMKLDITGTARSFDEVNFFMLGLKQSSFFKNDETQLINAQLINNPTRIEVPQNRGGSGPQNRYELPKVVQYKIQTSFNQEPASKLLAELDRKGAVGLVGRIRTIQKIQEKGESQP